MGLQEVAVRPHVGDVKLFVGNEHAAVIVPCGLRFCTVVLGSHPTG